MWTLAAYAFLASSSFASDLSSEYAAQKQFWDGAAKRPPIAAVAAPAHRPDFAQRFSPGDMRDPAKRDQFLRELMYWEGQFHKPGVGYNGQNGLTYDGIPIDPATGRPSGAPRAFSAASKESLHVALLAKAIAGDPYARIFVSPDDPARASEQALSLFERKLASYEKFDRDYPGFGGYIPWVEVGNDGMRPLPEWSHRVPALDNGELIWSLMAADQALRAAGKTQLAARVQAKLDRMAKNAGRMFFDERAGKIRAEASVPDPSSTPESQVYSSPGPGYYLDDPFEGELFVLYWSLYGGAKRQDIERVWASKTPESLEFQTRRGRITIRKGWEFSSHEEWNLLSAPYLDLPLVRRVMRNNQRARTWYSRDHGIDGLFAAAHAPESPLRYEAYGVPGAGSVNSVRTDAVVPYGAFPVMLTDREAGLAWYLKMLQHPGMQGPLGGGESADASGPGVAPVLTWDAKETAALAAIGGSADLARDYLRRTGKAALFRSLIERSYARGFSGELAGEDIPVAWPR